MRVSDSQRRLQAVKQSLEDVRRVIDARWRTMGDAGEVCGLLESCVRGLVLVVEDADRVSVLEAEQSAAATLRVGP